MDRGIPSPMSSRLLLLLFFHLVFFTFFCSASSAHGTGVFKVQRKLSRSPSSLGDLRAHDTRRHGRFLSAVDLPMGGLWFPYDAGLYYAQIAIGMPPKNYYVQVDTGSDLMWVNCIDCKQCPRKSSLGIELTLYDPKGSDSGHLVTCDQDFCYEANGGNSETCKPDVLCAYSIMYADGSSTLGYFVTDNLQYNQVSGNHQTKPVNASVTFGCGAKQSGDLGSTSQLDGILGFGQANSSMISQLASSRKVRKIFAHCLDSVNGGGIFAIGHVVDPKVNTTPLVPNQPHYNVNLKAIDVGGGFLQLPTDIFETSDNKGTVIDSGTTLAYLPEAVYKLLMSAIFSYLPNVSFQTIQDFLCFHHTGSVDEVFPVVTFHFQNSLTLAVYPHDYLFQNGNEADTICVGWQNSGMQSSDGKDMFLLGDLALSDKLVLYDLENQGIGWIEYNCSSSIKVQDDNTGAVYSIGAHSISSAYKLEMGKIIVLLLLTSILSYLTN